MKFTMTKLAASGAALALLLAAPHADAQQCCDQPNPCCNPCANWCNLCGNWEVGAHALVFTPVTCEFDYAVVQGDVMVASEDAVSTLKCELDWGFRVFGRYLSGCSFTGISYQWYQSKTSESATAPILTTRHNFPADKAIASRRIEYQNVDIRWGRYLLRYCGRSVYLFGNARWIDLKNNRSVRSINVAGGEFPNITIGTVTERAKLQGGALGIGAGAEFDVWCDVSLFGEANVLGVIANRSTNARADVSQSIGPTQQILPIRYSSDTCINPEVDFKLGLNYTYTCGCWTVVGEIGYEVDYFWKAFSIGRLDSAGSTESLFRQCDDVGFSGLFFGGRVLF